MNENVIIIIALVVGLFLIGWLLRLAASLIVAFTAFVIELPLILSILLFILFPPALIFFLIGLIFINSGDADSTTTPESQHSETNSDEIEKYKKRQSDLWSGNK